MTIYRKPGSTAGGIGQPQIHAVPSESMRAPQPSILVAGSLNLDLLLQVPQLPRPGETQTATGITHLPGGKGANQAVAAARLGASTTMLGCVGDDDAGRHLLAALREAAVETQFIIPCNEPTGTAAILLTPTGENSIVVAAGANALLSAEYVKQHRTQIAAADMVLTQLETPLAALQALLEITEGAGVPLMLDPAPAAPLPRAVLQKLTWFTPNETEADFYLRGSDTEAVADTSAESRSLCAHLQKLGAHNILLKLGSCGACVLTQAGEFFHVCAPRVEVVDTTGAGDILNAAFAVSLLQGLGVERALHDAVAAASLSVTHKGAMTTPAKYTDT